MTGSPRREAKNDGSFWDRVLRQRRQQTQRYDHRETASILRLTLETLRPLISGLAGFDSKPPLCETARRSEDRLQDHPAVHDEGHEETQHAA